MTEPTKILFQARQVQQVHDVTDLAGLLFPGNRNQQHAAARILLLLRQTRTPQLTLSTLEFRHSLSRRTLQRTRAKLARVGLIEHATSLSVRTGGQAGWKVSGRMSTALRLLADRIDQWRTDTDRERWHKEEVLATLLRPALGRRPRRGA